jgi:hypothetical protein
MVRAAQRGRVGERHVVICTIRLPSVPVNSSPGTPEAGFRNRNPPIELSIGGHFACIFFPLPVDRWQVGSASVKGSVCLPCDRTHTCDAEYSQKSKDQLEAFLQDADHAVDEEPNLETFLAKRSKAITLMKSKGIKCHLSGRLGIQKLNLKKKTGARMCVNLPPQGVGKRGGRPGALDN